MLKPNYKTMPNINERPAIDRDFDPLVDRLLSKFPENYCPDAIILTYWEKYRVQDAWRYLLEMCLRIDGKTDHLKASIEDLNVFMEDTCDLLTAVYVCNEEKKLPYDFEELAQENSLEKNQSNL